jgi:signal transduction histidine kinase
LRGKEDVATLENVVQSLDVAPHADWRDTGAGEHFVQFYEADAYLEQAVAEYVGEGLRRGGSGIVIATDQHRAGIEARIAADGVDLAGSIADGRYVSLGAAETLDLFMVDGRPDRERYRAVIRPVVRVAGRGGRPVRAFGEMVALLVAEGNSAAALALETLWNELQAELDFSLFCAYPLHGLAGESMAEIFDGVCASHGRVIPTERYTGLTARDDRLREISALQQKAESLEAALAAERRAREEAEAAIRMRDDFLSIAAHELKTPLTSLLGQAQLVMRRLPTEGTIDPARVAPNVAEIAEQARRLNRLITQLLDVSRLEGGQLALECQPTELSRLVARLVESARGWSQRHTLTLAAPDDLWCSLDAMRFEQVLANLLDNAVKYSPEGGEVEVRLTALPDCVELTVRDHGLGIPLAARDRVFERFYQAHPGGHQSGLGIGLFVTRQIVELHGGTIRFEHPDDGGTRFVVTLPL